VLGAIGVDHLACNHLKMALLLAVPTESIQNPGVREMSARF
jgi:hypothetical protein